MTDDSNTMSEEKIAEGYIREVIGSNLNEYKGHSKDERVGHYYMFKARILDRSTLEDLKQRFEIIAALPANEGDGCWNLEVKRIK